MGHDDQGARFESGSGRARLAVGFLIAVIVGDVLGMIADAIRVVLVSGRMNGGDVSISQLSASDSFVATTAVIQLILYIVTGILFLRWIYRAYRNLEALGIQGLQHSRVWAVGYWFVPFVSFYRPYMVTTEIWKASAAETNPTQPQGWKQLKMPSVFPAWWTFWLIGIFTGQISASLSLEAKELQDFISSDIWSLCDSAITIVAAIFCIAVIRSIDHAQESRHAKPLSIEITAPAFVPADGYDDLANSTADIDGEFPAETGSETGSNR